MKFANNLKNLRESQKITQVQLADYLSVSRPTITGYETKNRQPDFEKLEKISNFFNVSIDYLLTGSEFKKVPVNSSAAISENILNQEILKTYRQLSPESKEDTLKYIELLLLRDKTMKK